MLEMLSLALPATLFDFSSKDNFDDERVCVHVFNQTIALPKPVLARSRNIPDRPKRGSLFQIGIPELILCTKTISFLNMFQYFWPISRKEFQQCQASFSVVFKKAEITGQQDLDELARHLREQQERLKSPIANKAIILTFNDYTKYWCSHLIKLWQNSSIEEFVIFKDPTKSPYLCDYPSLQKGFKRPP